jgi:hypothetical protein
MKNLPIEKKEFYVIDYNDLEDFIIDHYNIEDFSFVADYELCNFIIKHFEIKKEKLTKWDQEKLDKFKTTEDYNYISHVLMTDLCNNDIIPEGNYLIKVFW